MAADDWFQEVYGKNVRKVLNSHKEKLWEWDGDSWLRMQYIIQNIRYKKNFRKSSNTVKQQSQFGWKLSVLAMKVWFQVYFKCFPLLLPPNMSAQIFTKCRSYFKIPGTRYVIWIMFHSASLP
jgi:hypothetical protein